MLSFVVLRVRFEFAREIPQLKQFAQHIIVHQTTVYVFVRLEHIVIVSLVLLVDYEHNDERVRPSSQIDHVTLVAKSHSSSIQFAHTTFVSVVLASSQPIDKSHIFIVSNGPQLVEYNRFGLVDCFRFGQVECVQ
jgi:hypothetical protein